MEDEVKDVEEKEKEEQDNSAKEVVTNMINNYGISKDELKEVLQEVLKEDKTEAQLAEEREASIKEYFKDLM